MGLFSKKVNKAEKEQLINGFLISEFESHFVNELSDDEFEKEFISASDAIKPFLTSIDKSTVQELADTLRSVSPENFPSLLGYSMALCWMRFISVSQNEKYRHLMQEDPLNTINTLLEVILNQIKGLLKR